MIERLLLQWLYKLDHLYGLLLTFGLALIIEGLFRNYFGSAGLALRDAGIAAAAAQNLGFMFLPNYRAWVIVVSLAVCLGTWFVIERTGSAPICAPRPKTRRWCARSASTCRA